MSSRHAGAFLFLILGAVPVAHAQIVVDSTFTAQIGAYGEPTNWSPPEVPNNSPEKSYNVSISGQINVNVDSTISNLTLSGILGAQDHSLAITGLASLNDAFLSIATKSTGATFSADSLSGFNQGALTGHYDLFGYTGTGWATLQFNGAHVTTLVNGFLSLSGPLTRIADEFGNDGLRDLAHVDSDSSLAVLGRQLVVPGPFTNDGRLSVIANLNNFGRFSIAGALTNFDAKAHTLTGGTYYIGGSAYDGSNGPTVFQFDGADIIHNAANLAIIGSRAQITDQDDNDALRNFAHNTATGTLDVSDREFSVAGDFTNDGVLSLAFATFTVKGSLTNFDPTTRTLTGGTYQLDASGVTPTTTNFVFRGADIVNNAASIKLEQGAKIYDENGNDAFRNFANNLAGGELTIRDYHVFAFATDFTNAGLVNFSSDYPTYRPEAQIGLTGSHRYRQTSGSTYFAYCHFAGDMVIDGGLFSTAASNAFYPPPAELEGNLEIGSAIFEPRHFTVHGSVHLSNDSHFRIVPHGYTAGIFQVAGTFTAAGALEIESITPPPSDSEGFAVVTAGVGVIGTFSNAPNGARVPTVDGLGSFVVSYGLSGIGLSHYQALPAIPRLLNISTRAQVGAAEGVLVGGFIVGGTQPTRILVRALGPSLGSIVPGVLTDPRLELHDSSGDLIASNDNWRSNQEQEITATGIPPSDDLESAIVATLPANNSAYTAVVRGGNDTGGIGVVELYDLDRAIDSKPINISTRGQVRAEEDALIGGFIALGQTSFRVIIRAIGPSLLVGGSLTDPSLNLYDGNGALIAFNDNWRSDQEAEIIATGIPPANDLESAIVATLPGIGGSYTAVLQGMNGASGIALVEVYDLNH